MENEYLLKIINQIIDGVDKGVLEKSELEALISECKALIVSNSPRYTRDISSPIAHSFINSYKSEFGNTRFYTIPVHRAVLDELFANNKQEVTITLGQESGRINFGVVKNGQFNRIDKREQLSNSLNALPENFNNLFGKEIDDYLAEKSNNQLTKSTRKFKLTRNVYDELVRRNEEALLFFPAICTDEELDDNGNLNTNQLTFVIALGKKTDQFTPSTLIEFDRSGLCPPGDC